MTAPAPWPHQQQAAEHLKRHRGAMLDMGMGTGKSRVVVEHVRSSGARRTLVVCPNSVVGVWRREFAKWAGRGRAEGVYVLDETGGIAKATMAEAAWGLADDTVFVVNYEAVRWRGPRDADPFCQWALSKRWDLVVADETHRIKGVEGQASRGMFQVGRRAGQRIGMTGTLVSNVPGDVWAQYRFVDVDLLGNSFDDFLSVYAVRDGMSIAAWRNMDLLMHTLRKVTFSATLADTDVSLPPIVHHERRVQLRGELAAHYSRLAGRVRCETDERIVCEAMVRMRQATSGIVERSSGCMERIESSKIDAVADLIEDADGPVVVFCQWRGEVSAVQEIADRLGRTYGELSGSRSDLTGHGTMPESVAVMAVQLQSGAVGVDLTRARHAVFLSHPWTPGEYEQAIARVHRPGQTRHVVVWHVLAEGTIDEAVWKALETKGAVATDVLAMLRR